jgi:hypothetical protein
MGRSVFIPSIKPLTKANESARLRIETRPDYQISLQDIENISDRGVALKKKGTDKYFRVKKVSVGRGYQYRFVADATNSSDPATHFRFKYKNINGEYWLALVSEARGSWSKTLQSDPSRDYTRFPTGHFTHWGSWEISGSLDDGAVFQHMRTNKFLGKNGQPVFGRENAGRFIIRDLNLADKVASKKIKIKDKKTGRYFYWYKGPYNHFYLRLRGADEADQTGTAFPVIKMGNSPFVTIFQKIAGKDYYLKCYPTTRAHIFIPKSQYYYKYEVRLWPPDLKKAPWVGNQQQWELSGTSLKSCYLKNRVTNTFFRARFGRRGNSIPVFADGLGKWSASAGQGERSTGEQFNELEIEIVE